MTLEISSDVKHILFVGAGAVGCFYASRIHNPSQNIHASLIARSNYKAIASTGKVTLHTRNFQTYTYHPTHVFPSVSTAASSNITWDYVVLTTKALPDVQSDSDLIAPLVTPGKTAILLIQNGVGVEAPLRTAYPDNVIVSGITIVSAEQTQPGIVHQWRWTRLSLGPYVCAAPESSWTAAEQELARRGDQATAALADWWKAGGVRDAEAHSADEMQAIRWHKLAINAAFNASAVLSGGLSNSEMVRDPVMRDHVLLCMREVLETAPIVLGAPLPEGLATPEQIIRSTERNTSDAKASMLVDWEAGRPMEIEVILGNAVRAAKEKGVEMSRIGGMYALLQSAQKARNQGKRSKQKL